MIAFVKGTVDYIEENSVVIDTGSYGAKIFMSPASLSRLKPGEEVKIHTFLRVAEDIFDLYGFLTREELDVFKMIISVNGAGPKAGLAVLSALSPEALTVAIITDDYKTITRAQGVGPKLAQKIVLEYTVKAFPQRPFPFFFADCRSAAENTRRMRECKGSSSDSLHCIFLLL